MFLGCLACGILGPALGGKRVKSKPLDHQGILYQLSLRLGVGWGWNRKTIESPNKSSCFFKILLWKRLRANFFFAVEVDPQSFWIWELRIPCRIEGSSWVPNCQWGLMKSYRKAPWLADSQMAPRTPRPRLPAGTQGSALWRDQQPGEEPILTPVSKGQLPSELPFAVVYKQETQACRAVLHSSMRVDTVGERYQKKRQGKSHRTGKGLGGNRIQRLDVSFETL